jgi:hypothetical protein
MRYMDAENGGKGKEWYGHSTLSVDGRNPIINTRGFYTEDFLKQRAGKAPCFYKNDEGIVIENHGFERINSVGCHKRYLRLSDNGLEIEDIVEGKRKHEITILYHVPHEIHQTESGYEILCHSKMGDLNRYLLTLPDGIKNVAIYSGEGTIATASDEYGREYGITTIEYKVSTNLPWRGKSTIKCI